MNFRPAFGPRTLAPALFSIVALLSACGSGEPSQPAAPEASPDAAAAAAASVVAPAEAAVAATGVLAEAPAGDLIPVDVIGDKGPTCNLEMINGADAGKPGMQAKVGSKVAVKGWMFSNPSKSVPANRYLRVMTEDSSQSWQTIVGGKVARPDILPWFGVGDWALPSGFEQEVDFGALPAGRYHLLLTYVENGKSYACDNGRMLDLVP